ncbi:ECF transporter S component [Haloimpatiens sp. FM7315]|uniref:ECF transporter S component n=1 Tax=Haloimpatiens sp. FM7315 TaxID=3298609 RepID=UPI0035A3432A
MKKEIETNIYNHEKAISITQMSLMIAIICLATMVIKIPTLMSIGYVHLGDSMVFLAAILFGKKKGMITAGIGMCLADILSGYAYYAPFTFVIKAVMALIAASIAYRGDFKGKNTLNNLFAFVISGIWMVFGYFIAKIFLVKFVLFKADSFTEALTIGLASIPDNIGQAAVGMLIALPLIKLLHNRLKIVK